MVHSVERSFRRPGSRRRAIPVRRSVGVAHGVALAVDSHSIWCVSSRDTRKILYTVRYGKILNRAVAFVFEYRIIPSSRTLPVPSGPAPPCRSQPVLVPEREAE